MILKCDVKGLNRLQQKLVKMADPARINEVVLRNTTELQEKAKRNAPVDTGFLQGSIRFDMQGGGKTGVVKATADYAQYVELGTRFMLAQPYMKPAFDEQKEIFLKDLKKAVMP